jgi:hypothetical protein
MFTAPISPAKPSASSKKKKDTSRSKKNQAEHDREVRRVANEYLKKGYKFWLTFKTGNNLTQLKG